MNNTQRLTIIMFVAGIMLCIADVLYVPISCVQLTGTEEFLQNFGFTVGFITALISFISYPFIPTTMEVKK